MASGIIVPTEAYAEIADIQQLLPKRQYHSASNPTIGQCEQMIKDVAKIIDARLRAVGYNPPLTATNDIIVLKHINALGAAAHIEAATLGVVQGESPIVEAYRNEYHKLLDDISSGVYEFETAGAPPDGGADGPDDLDDQGDRKDPIFINSQSERENQF